MKWSILAEKEKNMQLAITEAKARLTDLVRRAEAGEDVVLTRHGHAVVRLVAVHARRSVKDKANLIAAIRARAALKAVPGPAAARSQDFLYDDEGLPN
jgi:prevent-host-death family protein